MRKLVHFVFLLLSIFTLSGRAESIDEITDLASNPGNLIMYAYKPVSASLGAPLVVLLHGCMQDAKSFALKTGWIKKANELGIILLMPEQPKINNGVNCFTWFEEGDIVRDKGEVGSIAAMIDYMEAKFGTDPTQVFATGISAGGTMASALAASYPERIKSVAMVSAVSYGCTFSLLNSYTCMFAPPSDSPENRADHVRRANGTRTKSYPQILIVHGTSDSVVKFKNSTHSLEQWLSVHDIDHSIDATIPISGYEIQSYQDQYGVSKVERIVVGGEGHGWPVNPAKGCGDQGQFYIEGDLCLTDILAQQWGLK